MRRPKNGAGCSDVGNLRGACVRYAGNADTPLQIEVDGVKEQTFGHCFGCAFLREIGEESVSGYGKGLVLLISARACF